MRGWFGWVSLVLALGLVGVLVRKQMTLTSVPALPVPAAQDAATASPQPAGNAAQQSQQIQQQYRQALEGALQQARPMPDEK
jgi:hypothetical protein